MASSDDLPSHSETMWIYQGGDRCGPCWSKVAKVSGRHPASFCPFRGQILEKLRDRLRLVVPRNGRREHHGDEDHFSSWPIQRTWQHRSVEPTTRG
jgi:hypothetical protein